MTIPMRLTDSQVAVLRGDVMHAYLRHSGWDFTSSNERVETWVRFFDSRRLTLVLPLMPDADDYEQLLTEAVRVLAFAARKSVMEVLVDLEYGGADVVSVRLTSDAPSGQAPLTVAEAAMTALKDFVVGAAAGLTARGAVLRGPRRRADAFASRVRVSTSAGSFIVTLAVPLLERTTIGADSNDEPEVEANDQLSLAVVEDTQTPFGRQVATRMRRVATAALMLSDKVIAGEEDISVFENDPGASGNATELEALGEMGGKASEAYRLRFAESPVAPPDTAEPTVLVISPGSQEQFRRAAGLLRERKRKDDVTITGHVVGLARDAGLGPGQIVVRGREARAENDHRYRVQLSEDQFAQAVAAFPRRAEVSARGRLTIRGTFLWIEDLAWFSVQQALPEQQ